MIIGDAIHYMIEHMHEFEFIWASPPCQTHTQLCVPTAVQKGKPIPQCDFNNLYGWVNLERNWYTGYYIFENVQSNYHKKYRFPKPSIKLGRHFFWSNFPIKEKKFDYNRDSIDKITIEKLARFRDIDLEWLRQFKISSWTKKHDVYRTLLRNMVDADIGKYILDSITLKSQTSLERWA